ncbi:hypothetical protein BP6252_02958 [Coleophoma cylindrospora]|uniref:Uncharacterized protein n=1 Tax=Coleophoma cylindrospora TaxID=1849047 RepID=A0A3D8S6G1_9HELO|nr:hypothetical protein BP6252_02958 [Coleophoma cylindrospora]
MIKGFTMQPQQSGYEKIQPVEDAPPKHSEPSTTLLKSCLSIVLTAIVSVTLTVLILTSTSHLPNDQKPGEFSSVDRTCGSTLDEAIANGCIFDMMASRWEAPECFDEELLAAVLETGPWTWYSDSSRTIPIDRQEVAKGLFPNSSEPLYTDGHYHVGHCSYMWMKQHRALQRGGALEEDLWSFRHTAHCANMIRKVGWDGLELGRTTAGFSVCRTPDVWRRYDKEAEVV